MPYRWNAESVHQDEWLDPEDNTLAKGTAQTAPAQHHSQPAPPQSSKLPSHGSYHNQSPAFDQHMGSGYDQRHVTPATSSHGDRRAPAHDRQSNYSQYPTNHYQQQRQQDHTNQDSDVYTHMHNQYNPGYNDQYGYAHGQHDETYGKRAESAVIQPAPFELYSDPVISSAPFELYPNAADPYSTQGQGFSPGRGVDKAYYQGTYSAEAPRASAPSYDKTSQPHQQKQRADPLAFLTGRSNGTNPGVPGQQGRHVTLNPQQAYGSSGWDAPEQLDPHAGYQDQHQPQAANHYQAPINEGQRQRSNQRPPKVSTSPLVFLLLLCFGLVWHWEASV